MPVRGDSVVIGAADSTTSGAGGKFFPLPTGSLRVTFAAYFPYTSMPEILLKDWAFRRGVPYRTAQQWAKEEQIPARKKKKTIVMEKTWKCYVIDEDATVPGEGKSK